MEQIESGETPDKGLLVGNRAPERTLKFDFGVGIFLGEDDGIANTRRGVERR